MSTKEIIQAELDRLDEVQLVELDRLLREIVRPMRSSDQANGHVELPEGPLQRLRDLVIDAPTEFASDLERTRHGG